VNKKALTCQEKCTSPKPTKETTESEVEHCISFLSFIMHTIKINPQAMIGYYRSPRIYQRDVINANTIKQAVKPKQTSKSNLQNIP
jgi:hypothetical protein